MGTASRIWLALAGFLVTAGAIYGVTSHEFAGAPLLIVGAATFCYLGLVARSVARGAGAESGAEPEAEVHVAPTIWPFGFSIAGLVIVVGLVVSPWLVAVGLALFVVSAAGWLRDVARGHGHAETH